MSLRLRINALNQQRIAVIKNELRNTRQHTLQGLDPRNTRDTWISQAA
jgi:hypothetical protein